MSVTWSRLKPKTVKLRCIVAVWPDGSYYVSGADTETEESLLDLARAWDDGAPVLRWVNLEVPAPVDTGDIPTVELFIPGSPQ